MKAIEQRWDKLGGGGSMYFTAAKECLGGGPSEVKLEQQQGTSCARISGQSFPAKQKASAKALGQEARVTEAQEPGLQGKAMRRGFTQRAVGSHWSL